MLAQVPHNKWRDIFMSSKIIAQVGAIISTVILVLTVAVAQTNTAVTDTSDGVAESSQIAQTQRTQAIRRLLAIKEALEEKRERIRDLIAQREAADETDQAKIIEQIAALRETIDTLTKSLENIAVSGANLQNLARFRQCVQDRSLYYVMLVT
jgi:hypothetical protein